MEKGKHGHLSDGDIHLLRTIALRQSIESYSTSDQETITGRLLVERAEVLFEFLSRARELD